MKSPTTIASGEQDQAQAISKGSCSRNWWQTSMQFLSVVLLTISAVLSLELALFLPDEGASLSIAWTVFGISIAALAYCWWCSLAVVTDSGSSHNVPDAREVSQSSMSSTNTNSGILQNQDNGGTVSLTAAAVAAVAAAAAEQAAESAALQKKPTERTPLVRNSSNLSSSMRSARSFRRSSSERVSFRMSKSVSGYPASQPTSSKQKHHKSSASVSGYPASQPPTTAPTATPTYQDLYGGSSDDGADAQPKMPSLSSYFARTSSIRSTNTASSKAMSSDDDDLSDALNDVDSGDNLTDDDMKSYHSDTPEQRRPISPPLSPTPSTRLLNSNSTRNLNSNSSTAGTDSPSYVAMGYGKMQSTRRFSRRIQAAKSRRSILLEKELERPRQPWSAYNFFVREQRLLMQGMVANDSGSEIGTASTRSSPDRLFATVQRASLIITRGSRFQKKKNDEMNRIIGQKWKKLSKAKRASYGEMAKDDIIRYQREMADFNRMIEQGLKNEA